MTGPRDPCASVVVRLLVLIVVAGGAALLLGVMLLAWLSGVER